MENAKISIIVPCYNVETYIRECVESVLNQSYTNWELLLVDDGSTDKTYEVISELGRDDERIRVYTKANGGLPHTRNYALQYASGDYISLLDGDDYFAADHLAKVSEIIARSDSDMIIQNNHINFTSSTRQKIILFQPIPMECTEEDKLEVVFAKENFLPASAVLTTYKLDFLNKNGLRYEEKYKCSEDLDFFLRAISKGPKISFADHEFYFYRQDNVNAMTKNITGEMMLSRLSIYKKWIEFFDKKKIGSFDCVKIQEKLSFDLASQMKICFELEKEDGRRGEVFCFFKENRHLFQYNEWKQSFFLNYYILGLYRVIRRGMARKSGLRGNEVLVTVLMSVFNTNEEYLRKSIQSILDQSFTDYEFFIFNDCSDAKTTSILREYQDQRIKLIENAVNKGLTRNLNAGIRMARGKYIARMDADDVSLPKRLETQFRYMEKHCDVDVLGGTVVSDNEKYFCWRYYPQELRRVSLLFGNFGIFHPSAFFRTDFLRKKNLLYNEEYDKSQDYELWTRAFRVGKVAVCKEPVLYYRFHDGQISTSNHTKSRQKELDAKIRRTLFVELIPDLTDKESEQLLNLNLEILPAASLSNLFFRIVKENENKKIYSAYFLKNELALRWFWILRGIIPRNCANDYKQGEWFHYLKTPQFGLYLLKSRLLRILCEPKRIRKPVEGKYS